MTSCSKRYMVQLPPFAGSKPLKKATWYLRTKEGKGKGKVLPITGHEGPEGEQMYSSTLPSTSALDGGGWSTPRPGRFTPGKDPVPTVQEAA